MKSPETKSLIARLVVISSLIILQLTWMVALVTGLTNYSFILNALLTIASLFIIVYLFNKSDSPAYRISWIILIAVFPIFGTLFYLFAGNKRPLKDMADKMEAQIEQHERDLLALPNALQYLKERNPRLGSIAQYVNDVAYMPVHADVDVDYYSNGESMMDDLLSDLKKAESHIFLEFFIVETGVMFDAIFDVLKERAAAGVDVRIIYDDFGCLLRLPENFVEQMAAYNIKALKFNPVKPVVSLVYNTRNHRKYFIIDGKISYTGGLNIADEYINEIERFGYWKDTMIRMEGAATWNLLQLFLILWNAFIPTEEEFSILQDDETMESYRAELANLDSDIGYVQPFGDSPLDFEPVGENVYREILNAAENYVYIYTPYLVISYELQTAMTLAAKRGVDVRLMTPGIPDKKLVYRITRSFYRPLLEGGVKIYEFTPGFLHAKSFVSDDRIAVVGTINLDYRSLYLHFETATLLYYDPAIIDIRDDFLDSQAKSNMMEIYHTRRSFFEKTVDAVLRLLAPFV